MVINLSMESIFKVTSLGFTLDHKHLQICYLLETGSRHTRCFVMLEKNQADIKNVQSGLFRTTIER